MVSTRSATIADIHYIAKHMRESDCNECFNILGINPYETLLKALKTAKSCIVGEENGIVFCIVGLSQDNQVWTLFTKEFSRFTKEILIKSREVIQSFEKHGNLYGYTQSENLFIIKFVKVLGFTIEPETTMCGMKIRVFRKEVLSCAYQY